MKDGLLLNQYIKDIAKYPLLNAEEELDLSRRIQNDKDQVALQKLVRSNLKLVVKISMDLCRGSSSIMDVIQNGNMGLMRAAERYDYRKAVRFSTYAAFWIRQAILRGFIKPSKSVNISFHKDELNKKIKNHLKSVMEETGHYPTVDQIVEDLKVRRKDALDVLLMVRSAGDLSMNSSAAESSEEFIDSFQDNRYNPEKVIESRLMAEDIMKAIECQGQRECSIIKRRFGFDQFERDTLHSIGAEFSITAEATRQIERKVLKNIRAQNPGLAYYLSA